MEIELKEIREQPLALYVIIALVVHAIIGYGVFFVLTSPSCVTLRQAVIPHNPLTGINPVNETGNPVKTKNDESLPPFEPSSISSKKLSETTFIHERSGLLFADEISQPSAITEIPFVTKNIIEPKAHREFTLESLPREFRNREWKLTLRLRVTKNGDPVGYVRVVKSSGDKVLDQLTINRIKESRFEPAHYEGSTDYFDYTFDMEIYYH